MKLVNAKVLMDAALEKGYAIPALNANGATYDIAAAIMEAANELRSPLIIQAYAPNLEYRGYDYFAELVKFIGRDKDIPVAISLDHGKDLASIMKAIRAGFTHVMFDYASHPIAENIEQTNLVASLVRPLDISLEAEIGNIFISTDGSTAPVTPVEDVKTFLAAADVDFLAVGVGSTHGIFEKQDAIDFGHIKTVKAASDVPIVLHGTCGVSMEDITHCVKNGMNKINFGEGLRMNYIKYFNEYSKTLDHQHHAWRIMQAAKNRLKEDVKEIIRAVGSDGKLD